MNWKVINKGIVETVCIDRVVLPTIDVLGKHQGTHIFKKYEKFSALVEVEEHTNLGIILVTYSVYLNKEVFAVMTAEQFNKHFVPIGMKEE